MKIYLSGKMTGLKPRQIKKNFKRAEEKILMTLGDASIMNPAVTYHMSSIKEFSYLDWLKIDFAMIDACDAVFLLPNWVDSEGAKKEIVYAFSHNKKVFYPSFNGLLYKECDEFTKDIVLKETKKSLKKIADDKEDQLLEETARKILGF